MKYIILSIFTLLFFPRAKTQDYIPLVKEGATWVYQGYGDISNYQKAFHILGQEERNGKLYYRLLAYDIIDQQAIGPSYLMALLREEDKKVYGYYLMDFFGYAPHSDQQCGLSDTEVLYYDFDLMVGDTMDMCITQTDREPIGSVDSEFKFGMDRRIYVPEEERGNYLIEGLGTEMGIFHFFGIFYHAAKGLFLKNHCVGSIADCIQPSSYNEYITKNDLNIYPNPISDKIQMDISLDSYAIYNIQGQKIISGINYIRNVEIDISNLSDGMYTLIANKDNELFTARIIVK